MLERSTSPPPADRPAETLHRAGCSLDATLLVAMRDEADQARHRRMAEAHAERERDERDGEQQHGGSERRRDQPDSRAAEPEQEGRFVAQTRDDRTDEGTLNRRSEEAESRKEVASVRGVEAETPRDEESERRLEHRKRAPVHEIDHQDPAHQRPREELRQISKRIADPGAGAM